MIEVVAAVLAGLNVALVVLAFWEHRYHTAARFTIHGQPTVILHLSEDDALQLAQILNLPEQP